MPRICAEAAFLPMSASASMVSGLRMTPFFFVNSTALLMSHLVVRGLYVSRGRENFRRQTPPRRRGALAVDPEAAEHHDEGREHVAQQAEDEVEDGREDGPLARPEAHQRPLRMKRESRTH